MIEAALLALVLANPSALAFSLVPVERELRVGDAIEYEAAPLPSPQAAIKPPRQWITLTNHPGWQGLGRIVNGWVIDIVATRPLAPAPTPPAPAPAVAGDSYGVGSWLNAVRARSGLGPLAYDANLSANAQANSSRGFGHNVGGYGMGQVVGMGGLAAVESMWLADPPHYAILLTRGATRYGLGVSGSVWTINVN
jgi:hypothetical protein